MTPQPRIEAARRRANAVNRVLAVGSAAAFAAVLVLVRVTHPATASSKTHARSAASTRSARGDDGFDFGSGSVSSSDGAAPQVQTSVS